MHVLKLHTPAGLVVLSSDTPYDRESAIEMVATLVCRTPPVPAALTLPGRHLHVHATNGSHPLCTACQRPVQKVLCRDETVGVVYCVTCAFRRFAA